MAIRNRIDRVRRAGEQRRGTYMPPRDSAVYKMYRWWQEQTGYSVARENFCHFYRVVLIWAPLRWVGQKLSKSFGLSSIAVFGVLLLLGIIEGLTIGLAGVENAWVPLQIAALAVGVIGSVVGFVSYIAMDDGNKSLFDVFEELIDKDDKMSVGMFLVLLAGPALLAGQLLAWIIHRIWVSPPVKFFRGHGEEVFFVGMTIFGSAAIFGLLVHPFGWLWGLVYLVAGLAALAVIFGVFILGGFLINLLVEFIKDKKMEKRERLYRERQALIDAGNQEALNKYYGVKSDTFVSRLFDRTRSAFDAVVDVLSLAFEAVRVTKWQICPLVDIPMLETASVGGYGELDEYEDY